MKLLEAVKVSYRDQLVRIASQVNQMHPHQLAEAIRLARENFNRVVSSPEITALRSAVLNAVQENAPLEQRN